VENEEEATSILPHLFFEGDLQVLPHPLYLLSSPFLSHGIPMFVLPSQGTADQQKNA
jgi:hypothetical protein